MRYIILLLLFSLNLEAKIFGHLNWTQDKASIIFFENDSKGPLRDFYEKLNVPEEPRNNFDKTKSYRDFSEVLDIFCYHLSVYTTCSFSLSKNTKTKDIELEFIDEHKFAKASLKTPLNKLENPQAFLKLLKDGNSFLVEEENHLAKFQILLRNDYLIFSLAGYQ